MHQLLLFCSVSSASAFEQEGIAAGNTETSFFGDISSSSSSGGGTSNSSLILGTSQGYFINDPTEIGLAVLLTTNGSAGNTSGSMSLEGFTKYHFLGFSPTTVPYVGIKLGMTENITAGAAKNASSFSYGANAGVKMFNSETNSLGIEGYYTLMTFNGAAISRLGLNLTLNFYSN